MNFIDINKSFVSWKLNINLAPERNESREINVKWS